MIQLKVLNSFIGNRLPLSEPEHDSHTKNSLLNDLQSMNEHKKGLESTCDYICDIFIDHDVGECKKCTFNKSPKRNLLNVKNMKKPKSLSKDSESSKNASSPPSIRRSRRL